MTVSPTMSLLDCTVSQPKLIPKFSGEDDLLCHGLGHLRNTDLSLLRRGCVMWLLSNAILSTAASSLTVAGDTARGLLLCVAECAADRSRLALEEVEALLASSQDTALALEFGHGHFRKDTGTVVHGG